MLGKKVKVFGHCLLRKVEIDTVGFLVKSSVEGMGVCYWTRPGTANTTFTCVEAVPGAPGKWVSNLFADGLDLVQFEEQ